MWAYGDISVIGLAINDADGVAKSKAAINFGGSNGLLASSIHIANVLVDALASERGAGAASASASLIFGRRSVPDLDPHPQWQHYDGLARGQGERRQSRRRERPMRSPMRLCRHPVRCK